MRADEYEIMFRVEDHHAWYRALRRIIAMHWSRYVPTRSPLVLDAGCGTGALSNSLARRAKTVGIDISPVALRLCRRRGLTQMAVASVLRLPFPDACFDVVISCDVLCHAAVPDKREALRELARVLKPGGLLLLNLPAYPRLLSSHDHAVHNDRRFTRGEMLGLLREQELTPLRATYWNSLLFLPIAMIRLWRKFRPARHSDLAAEVRPWFNRCLAILFALEGVLIRLMPLPFGLSIFLVARKSVPSLPQRADRTPRQR